MPFCPICFRFLTNGVAKRHKHKKVVAGVKTEKKK